MLEGYRKKENCAEGSENEHFHINRDYAGDHFQFRGDYAREKTKEQRTEQSGDKEKLR